MSIFPANKTTGFKFNEEQALFVNQVLSDFEIDATLTKRDQFYTFAEKAKELLELSNAPVSESPELFELRTALNEARMELAKVQEANTDLLFAVANKDDDLTELKKYATENQAKISELENKEPPPAPTLQLKENEYLVTLPPFQHHLIASAANNPNALAHFDKVAHKTRNLILSMPHIVKENTAVAMINFTVGAILNYHKGADYLPEMGSAVPYKKIEEAMAFAIKEAEKEAKRKAEKENIQE